MPALERDGGHIIEYGCLKEYEHFNKMERFRWALN